MNLGISHFPKFISWEMRIPEKKIRDLFCILGKGFCFPGYFCPEINSTNKHAKIHLNFYKISLMKLPKIEILSRKTLIKT